jgi:hypothetical protein
VRILFGAWGVAFSQGEIAEAELHLAELMRASEEAPDASMSGWVCYAEAATVYAHGDLGRADRLLDRIFSDSPADVDREFGLDLAVVALSHRLSVMWHLGRIGDAAVCIEKYLRRAEATSSWELAMSLMSSCGHHIATRNAARVSVDAGRLRLIAEEASLPTFLGWADIYLGWAMAAEGEEMPGIASMRAGVSAYLATGQRTGHPGYLAWIAQAQLRSGDTVSALETISQAADALPEEVVHFPAISIVRGMILEADPQLASAGDSPTTCYDQAVAAAQKLGSVMTELQAAIRIAGMRLAGGDRSIARDMLEPLLARVVGGDHLADVKAARALLDRAE